MFKRFRHRTKLCHRAGRQLQFLKTIDPPFLGHKKDGVSIGEKNRITRTGTRGQPPRFPCLEIGQKQVAQYILVFVGGPFGVNQTAPVGTEREPGHPLGMAKQTDIFSLFFQPDLSVAFGTITDISLGCPIGA